MRKAAAILLALGIGLTACRTGTNIGGDLSGGRSDIGGSATPTVSATPTKSKPPRVRKTQEPKTDPTPTTGPAYKPVTYTIAIRGTNNFYEWKGGTQTDWRQADTGGPRVFNGDIIIFKNMDSRGTEHSLTNGNQGARDFGKVFDLGPIDPGEQRKWVVTDDFGCYYYTDRIVNYYRGGPMQIVDRENVEAAQQCA